MIEETEAYGLTFRYPALDTAVGASLRDYGEFARPELDLMLAYAEGASGTLVDVGAHVGTLLLPFAAARPGWRTIGIEAFYQMADLVREGAQRNAISNVEVFSVAAGEEAGVADFPAAELWFRGNFGRLGFNAEGMPGTRKVGVRPLDDIAPADTRLVKVDVEGFEPSVVRGARRLLRESRPLWLIETHRNALADREAIAAVLAPEGYSLFWFFSPFATPAAPKRQPEDPGKGDLGLVALPPGAPNLWNLPPAADLARPPSDSGEFPYLRLKYGYP
ncbi:MAG: FkbM family methyltransferase [Phenylobacterium sp.]|uniref:FkbM family methyltransferase n=1 Tax=Phenylobacterium sp. TaxID=1871053 RepID=UPI00121526BF|nr:FkbM family methyltransferase [Phenylobacterium sp.]TAL34667.1 MAG: FkbM family methyltransferase [Phenylobacterium sp.]